MSSLFQESIRLYNLPITVCFGIVLLFWCLTVFGIFDTDSLEPDLDLDADVDTDIDADLDTKVASPGIGVGILRFFNVGEIPIMILLSVCVALSWAGSVLGNYYFNPGHGFLLGIGIFLMSDLVSLFLTKIVTTPLKPIMRRINAGEKHRPVIGRTCVIRTSEVTTEFGQAECEDDSGNPLLLHVRISEGQKHLAKGDRVLVVDTLDDAQTYIVRKLES